MDIYQFISSIKITACNLPSETEGCVDVCVFPDHKKYSLRASDLSDDLTSLLGHLSSDTLFSGTNSDLLFSHFIFVCCDAATDKRCGFCGPKLVNAFEERVKEKGLTGMVKVVKTSHVGGHKYAGNVIAFPPGWFFFSFNCD